MRTPHQPADALASEPVAIQVADPARAEADPYAARLIAIGGVSRPFSLHDLADAIGCPPCEVVPRLERAAAIIRSTIESMPIE